MNRAIGICTVTFFKLQKYYFILKTMSIGITAWERCQMSELFLAQNNKYLKILK